MMIPTAETIGLSSYMGGIRDCLLLLFTTLGHNAPTKAFNFIEKKRPYHQGRRIGAVQMVTLASTGIGPWGPS